MFPLNKTRAAEYADLSSVNRIGFIAVADPINCIAEVGVAFQEADGPIVELMGQEAVDFLNQQQAEGGFPAAAEANG